LSFREVKEAAGSYILFMSRKQEQTTGSHKGGWISRQIARNGIEAFIWGSAGISVFIGCVVGCFFASEVILIVCLLFVGFSMLVIGFGNAAEAANERNAKREKRYIIEALQDAEQPLDALEIAALKRRKVQEVRADLTFLIEIEKLQYAPETQEKRYSLRPS